MEDNALLQPTRCGIPEFWMHALMTGKAIPWLWDMNQDMCMVKHHFRKPGESKDDDWDWELLVRQLSQANVFDYGQPMSEAPKGLRNRRRIWKCCRELMPDTGSMERLRRKPEDEFKKTPTKISSEPHNAVCPPSSSTSKGQVPGTCSTVVETLSIPAGPQKKTSKRGLARMFSRMKGKHS